MTKEKTNQATPSRDVMGAPNHEFAVNLLEQLQFIGAKELIGVRTFFSEAFLLHTDDEVFDDNDYRREWATNINTIHALCICIEKHSEEQINNAIAHSISILKKKVRQPMPNPIPQYRNKEDITTPQGVVIDAGSLFELQDGVLTLVDDDFYYETDLDLNLFTKE